MSQCRWYFILPRPSGGATGCPSSPEGFPFSVTGQHASAIVLGATPRRQPAQAASATWRMPASGPAFVASPLHHAATACCLLLSVAVSRSRANGGNNSPPSELFVYHRMAGTVTEASRFASA